MMSSQMWPTNPGRRVFYPIGTMSLQGGDAGADMLMRQLMGPRYARLNPPVMDMPLLISSLLARFKAARSAICDEIEKRLGSAEIQRACDTVDEYFLKSPAYWAEPHVWVSAPLGPMPSYPSDDEALDEALLGRKSETEFVGPPATPPPGLKEL